MIIIGFFENKFVEELTFLLFLKMKLSQREALVKKNLLIPPNAGESFVSIVPSEKLE